MPFGTAGKAAPPDHVSVESRTAQEEERRPTGTDKVPWRRREIGLTGSREREGRCIVDTTASTVFGLHVPFLDLGGWCGAVGSARRSGHRAHHYGIIVRSSSGCGAVGSARRSGRRGRRFESNHHHCACHCRSLLWAIRQGEVTLARCLGSPLVGRPAPRRSASPPTGRRVGPRQRRCGRTPAKAPPEPIALHS